MSYRKINEKEISVLKQNFCVCENWDNIFVKEGFIPQNLRKVKFEGKIKLGVFSAKLKNYNNIDLQSGIFHSRITNCEIEDNVRISNVNRLHNYSIGENTIIENVNTLVVSEKSSFGIGKKLEILNEGGGRELSLFPDLSSQLAYILIHYKDDDILQNKLSQILSTENEKYISETGTIGKNVKIANVKEISNVNISNGATIQNSASLVNGTIICSEIDPVYVGANIVAKNFIMQSGANVDSSANIENCFIGEAVSIGKQFSAENSAFFANCEGFHGEACSIFAGPYTVTHHKSTLLIASYYSFFNAGSGTNHSNHMYKLGPIHQGILERGAKTGSFSYLLLPSRVGPFSVVIGKHFNNFDASDFPFSYISEENERTSLTPAMNLFTVGTKRDTEKWAKRDKRKSNNKLDQLSFDLFSPFIIGRMITASNLLDKFILETPKEKKNVNYKGIQIPRLILKTCKKYYDLGIKVGIGEHLVNQLKVKRIADILKDIYTSSSENEKWFDIGGLFISNSDWIEIREKILNEKLNSIIEINNEFKKVNENYSFNSWKWTASVIKEKYSNESEISVDTIKTILEDWHINKTKLLNMILKDAEKEFDISSKIAYGIDGDETVRDKDFENVRGNFEENKFVIQLKKEIDETTKEFENLNSIIFQ